MRSGPDSALAIIEALDRDSLAAEGDCAYHNLLLTQTLDRNLNRWFSRTYKRNDRKFKFYSFYNIII